jgi:hypothetical protein
VLWHVTMSVDGFIAGHDDTMDWVFEYPSEPNPVVDEAIRSIGAILAGRRWHEATTSRYDGQAGIYRGAWTGPVFVLTTAPVAMCPTRGDAALRQRHRCCGHRPGGHGFAEGLPGG